MERFDEIRLNEDDREQGSDDRYCKAPDLDKTAAGGKAEGGCGRGLNLSDVIVAVTTRKAHSRIVADVWPLPSFLRPDQGIYVRVSTMRMPMMVSMSPQATPEQIAAVVARIEAASPLLHAQVVTGVVQSTILVIGDPDAVNELDLQGMPEADHVARISVP